MVVCVSQGTQDHRSVFLLCHLLPSMVVCVSQGTQDHRSVFLLCHLLPSNGRTVLEERVPMVAKWHVRVIR